MKIPAKDHQIEEAIKFLVFAFNDSGKNPKPVILHSIRVGLHLYHLDYNPDIVISAILHDIIEDTDTTIDEVKSKFGEYVAELVLANSLDKISKDKTETYKENFLRCKRVGKDALIVRAADFFDNLDYYHLAPSKEVEEWLHWKINYFIVNSKSMLGEEGIYSELVAKYIQLSELKNS